MSGLVCGCYLAKAGMKVLIAEQHHKPGGYCTSFTRKGFTFDAAAHSFGSYRVGGNMHTVLNELGIVKKIHIKRYDPPDVIITPDYKITFRADYSKTVQELENNFPRERAQIHRFFTFMANPQPLEMAALRRKTFKQLLDEYFTDDKLKSILSISLLGNGGLPPSLMSAFAGAKIFTEFLIDGGYYPEGGMQALPDALAERFQEFGGRLLLSSRVERIAVKDDTACGIISDKCGSMYATYIISNCDARQTFLKFLGKRLRHENFSEKLKKMTPTLSMFIIYLGLDTYFDALPEPGTTTWFMPHYSVEELYISAKKRSIHNMGAYLLRVSPDKKTVLAMTNTSFKNRQYWSNNKAKFSETFVALIERSTVPGLSEHISFQEAATPSTLQRYTSNFRGASYGWESTPSQFADMDMRKPSFIKGLYLTGHWTTYAQGIAGVVYLGYDTAKLILKKRNKAFSD